MQAKDDLAPIAIVGAGASGAAAALHLFHTDCGRPVLLFDRDRSRGRGLAYSTSHAQHWLNVPAHNMGLYADRPDHFLHWCRQVHADTSPACVTTPLGLFATRALYGSYLAAEISAATTKGNKLRLIEDEAVAIARCRDGYEVRCSSGQTFAAAGVVLALGHPRPGQAPSRVHYADPWGDVSEDLKPDMPVVIAGSGLTMVDVAITLKSAGLTAPILAISRRGLLPHTHEASKPNPAPQFPPADRQSAVALLHDVRSMVAAAGSAGIGWRGVVDSLRPVTQPLWRSLPLPARAQFLRHLRPWWDAHRHRLAPNVGDTIRQMRESGALDIAAGRIVTLDIRDDHAVVHWRRRGTSEIRTMTVQKVIEAMGIDMESISKDPLRQQMLQDGIVRPGPLGLGFEVSPDLNIVARDGRPHENLWALGPLTRGVFWECTAVPDIRVQAAKLAALVAEKLRPSDAATAQDGARS